MSYQRLHVVHPRIGALVAILGGCAVLLAGGPTHADSLVLMPQAKVTANDPMELASLGWSVATSGETAVGGAPDFSDITSGSAYVFVRSEIGWSQQQKLTPGDAAPGDGFGWSVSISGDTIVVGSPFDDDAGDASGSAYVFVRSGGSWVQQQKLTAYDATPDVLFGFSVAISGETVVVGSLGASNGSNGRGAAYVFVRSGSSWSLQQKLIATDSPFFFGFSVAIDGDSALVGAAPGFEPGGAYVFVRSGAAWTQQQKLSANGGAPSAIFGWAVALSGETAIVGAPFDTPAGVKSGAAYVFVRSGASWSQQAQLTAADGAAGDQFGGSVALDGDLALVGASLNAGENGAAYTFNRDGTSWHQRQKLTTADHQIGRKFGTSVALSDQAAAVSLPGDGNQFGAVYLFVPVAADNLPPVADAGPDQTVECTSPLGASTLLDGTRSSDPDGDPLTFLWTGPFGQATGAVSTVQLPLGSNTVTLTVADGRGGTGVDTARIVVQDTIPPTIFGLIATPSRLWPADHQMVPVKLDISVGDLCDRAPSCVIETVTSNEPIVGDFSITGPLQLDLRAERFGSGSGRTYSIVVGCQDSSGNRSTAAVWVLVPHDQASP